MKVLIGQILIKKRFSLKNTLKYSQMIYYFEKKFQRSVIAYCKKNKYDYTLITKPSLKLPLHTGEYGANERLVLFSKYKEYDYIAHIDIDIFITEHAPPLPLNIDFAAVLDDQKTVQKLNISIPNYCNGGVYYFNAKTAHILWEETLKLQKEEYSELHDVAHANQTVVNYWILKNKIQRTLLDDKWNTMHFSPNWAKRLTNSYFIHYSDVRFKHRYLLQDFPVHTALKLYFILLRKACCRRDAIVAKLRPIINGFR